MNEEVSPYSQAPEAYLRTLRALAETYHQVMLVTNRHIESLGLTPAQFDILATLGDTAGMTCKQLGQGTLITKGTLTGVLDRLEDKGLISRSRGEKDSRQIFVRLTPEGEKVFNATFQPQVDFMGKFFEGIPAEHQLQLQARLKELREAFSAEAP